MNEPTQIIYDFNFDSEDVYEINVLFKGKKIYVKTRKQLIKKLHCNFI